MYLTHKSQRHILVSLLLAALSLLIVGTASANTFPEVISLPDGFQPEGIATGKGSSYYVGSIPTGAIYRGDYLTGKGELLVEPVSGRSAIGLKYDPRTDLLFVAGGATGKAFLYDAETGDLVAEIQLSVQPTFINDVVITRDAVYFTSSFQPVIYRVPLEPNGTLSSANVETILLGGDYLFTPGAFNANGVTSTPNGDTLIIVNSTEGALYRVEPTTGFATRIDLGTGSVPNGDGILLQGKTLYVVQNRLNQIAFIELDADFSSGTIEDLITSSYFRVPTTIARFGGSLYVVNARFGTPPTPDTDYNVVNIPQR